MAEDEDSPTADGELPLTTKKATAPELQGQQRREIAPEEVGHISGEEEMVTEGGLMSSDTGAKSGGTGPSNARKQSTLAREEHLLRSLRKLKHSPEILKMWQKQEML